MYIFELVLLYFLGKDPVALILLNALISDFSFHTNKRDYSYRQGFPILSYWLCYFMRVAYE